jgi:hypothetical protein
MISLAIKEAIGKQRGMLIYFGDVDTPLGLVYDEPITEDMLDMICDKIKERMREIIKK